MKFKLTLTPFGTVAIETEEKKPETFEEKFERQRKEFHAEFEERRQRMAKESEDFWNRQK